MIRSNPSTLSATAKENELLDVIQAMYGSFVLMGFRTDDEGLKSLRDAHSILKEHGRL